MPAHIASVNPAALERPLGYAHGVEVRSGRLLYIAGQVARDRHGTMQGKGDLVAQLVGDRDAIADSDQGRSFQAFYDLLMSPSRQHELRELLRRVQELDAVSDPDPRLGRINRDWLDAAEDTQATVRSLSSQLRRFLDDQAWAENRRVVELSKRIEQHAISLRGDIDNAPGAEIASPAPTLVLPFERPMYKPRHKSAIQSDSVRLADDDVDVSALFTRSRVDRRQLADNVWSLLRSVQQVSLTTVVDRFGLEMGLAELVGYLALRDPRFEAVFDPQHRATVAWVEDHDRRAVVEGRDIGSVVFPHATVKVYLDARPDVRATRRARQTREDPEAVAFEVARRKAGSYAHLEPEAAYRRLVGYLARRGHAEGLARKVARQVVWVEREQDRITGH